MNALQRNDQTGFLESPTYNRDNAVRNAFTSDRKVAFLELAKKYTEKKSAPNLKQICTDVGIGMRTLYDHLRDDVEFKAQFDAVWLEVEDAVVSAMVESAVKPTSQGVTDRIFLLKNKWPERWGDEKNVNISLDIAGIKQVIESKQGFIDAEVVPPVDNSTKDLGNTK